MANTVTTQWGMDTRGNIVLLINIIKVIKVLYSYMFCETAKKDNIRENLTSHHGEGGCNYISYYKLANPN